MVCGIHPVRGHVNAQGEKTNLECRSLRCWRALSWLQQLRTPHAVFYTFANGFPSESKQKFQSKHAGWTVPTNQNSARFTDGARQFGREENRQGGCCLEFTPSPQLLHVPLDVRACTREVGVDHGLVPPRNPISGIAQSSAHMHGVCGKWPQLRVMHFEYSPKTNQRPRSRVQFSTTASD